MIKIFSGRTERTVKAKKHIAYTFVLKGITIAISFLYVPLLLDYLDSERYGIWITLSSILGWFEFFNVGLGSGLRNRFAEAQARGDQKLARVYVSTTYAVLGMIFLGLLALFLVVNPFLDWNRILNTEAVPARELTLLAGVVFTFFVFRFIFKLIGTILMADQRPAINEALLPIGNVIVLLAILILLRTNGDGSLVVLGLLLSGVPVLVLILASVILFRGKYRTFRPSFRLVRLSLAGDLVGLGARFFIIQVAGIVVFATSNIIITQVFSPHDVTVYNIAFKYFQIPIMVYAIIMTPIWSAVTEAYVNEDYDWLRGTLRKLSLVSLLFVAGIALMLVLSATAYRIWIGDRVEIPFLISAMMAVFAAVNVCISPFSQFINGMGRLRLSTLAAVLQIGIFFPLALYLAHTSLAVAGVILAVTLVNGLSLLYQPLQTHLLIRRKAHGIWKR